MASGPYGSVRSFIEEPAGWMVLAKAEQSLNTQQPSMRRRRVGRPMQGMVKEGIQN